MNELPEHDQDVLDRFYACEQLLHTESLRSLDDSILRGQALQAMEQEPRSQSALHHGSEEEDPHSETGNQMDFGTVASRDANDPLQLICTSRVSHCENDEISTRSFIAVDVASM